MRPSRIMHGMSKRETTAPREIAERGGAPPASKRQTGVPGEREGRGHRRIPFLGKEEGRRRRCCPCPPPGAKKDQRYKKSVASIPLDRLGRLLRFFFPLYNGLGDQSESARRSALACPMGRKTEWAAGGGGVICGRNGKKAEEIPLPFPHRSWASQKWQSTLHCGGGADMYAAIKRLSPPPLTSLPLPSVTLVFMAQSQNGRERGGG